jgi:hypothetical protein
MLSGPEYPTHSNRQKQEGLRCLRALFCRILADMFTILAAVMLLIGSTSQVVQTGATDPDYCYKIETIRPNLKLLKPAHILGSITDVAGSAFKNSRVELRKCLSQRKQTTIKTVVTDAYGKFDLGAVEPGSYRLLASPTRAFRQPAELVCREGTCDLKIVLQINATDQADSICPIR